MSRTCDRRGGGRHATSVSLDEALIDLIDTIGEAALDPDLWPIALTRLADSLGVGQVAMASLDERTKTFASIAPRTDPEDIASYAAYWAFHNPAWSRSTTVPTGQVFSIDSLVGREVFAKTAIFNEWWKPAQWSLTSIGANLVIEDRLTALVCVDSGPCKDALDEVQVRAFELALQHIHRAVRIQRKICRLDLARVAAAEQLDALPHGVVLVDAGARIILANNVARSLLATEDALAIRDGCLEAVSGGALADMIAGCVARPGHGSFTPRGGELEVKRGLGRAPLRVTVAAIPAERRIAEVPWLGLRAPVAIVAITDPEMQRRRIERYMREKFGLTPAESCLATEISKGDGRKAAAQRRGVALSTARAQLTSIFEKTGTRRQAELVRLVHDVSARVHIPEEGCGVL
jgi:DNA-binding CsgD family transcriptional regulator